MGVLKNLVGVPLTQPKLEPKQEPKLEPKQEGDLSYMQSYL